jgi:tetratricopeptide (TPR) repeat protein
MFRYSSLILTAVLLFTQISFAQTDTAKSLFTEGLSLLRQKKLDESLAVFRKSLQLDAKQPATHANIGFVLSALNRIPESIPYYREAVRLAPNESSFHSGLCKSLSLTKNHDEAIAECKEGVRLGNSSPEPFIALIAALRNAKRNDEALQNGYSALQRFANNENLLLTLAEAEREDGNYQNAFNFYQTLSELKPTGDFYLINLSFVSLRLERDAEAVEFAQRAIAINPNNATAHYYVGKVYFELGLHEEAINSFKKATELDNTRPEMFYYLGLSYSRNGKSENAIAALRKAVSLSSDDFDYLYKLGDVLNGSAKYEEAIIPLQKAVQLEPKNFLAKVSLGLALFESAKYAEALPVLTEADQMKPANEVVTMFLRVTRSRQQGFARIDEMKEFAKRNPKDLNVRVQLAINLGYGRRISEAESYIQEILKINPENPKILSSIAVVYSTSGNREKAAEIYRKIIELGDLAQGYSGLLNYYEKKGMFEEADAYYQKLFAIKSDVPHFLKSYGDFLRNNGKRREALEAYKRSLALLPNNSPTIFNIALLSIKLGDRSAATQYLEMLKSIDPAEAKLLARCIRFYR